MVFTNGPDGGTILKLRELVRGGNLNTAKRCGSHGRGAALLRKHLDNEGGSIAPAALAPNPRIATPLPTRSVNLCWILQNG